MRIENYVIPFKDFYMRIVIIFYPVVAILYSKQIIKFHKQLPGNISKDTIYRLIISNWINIKIDFGSEAD
jgi:hypothetical protein